MHLRTLLARLSTVGVLVMLCSTSAIGATTVNLVVTPSSPIFSSAGNNVVGVANDAAPGYPFGSFASNGTAKTDMYFTPAILFGRDVTVGEIEGISVHEISPPEEATSPSLVYVRDPKFQEAALRSPASILLLDHKSKPDIESYLRKYSKENSKENRFFLFSKNVNLAMALINQEYFGRETPLQKIGSIHPSAVISPSWSQSR